MTSAPAPVALENDPRNPCVGCGPEHPTGLRLTFRREGDAVATTLAASGRFQGWPGRLHSGILYLAMLETANWTLFGLLGRVGLPVRTSALDAKRWVATGETLLLTGRLIPSGETAARARIEATDAKGSLVAVLERDYDLPDRATFLKRMGYTAVPSGLEDAMPE
ncbi:MAG TPA: hypothetical protein VEY12_12480 [Thermoplasmata archaeon]|nr:hypothetical protein [Thermoplasmata archaeon]